MRLHNFYFLGILLLSFAIIGCNAPQALNTTVIKKVPPSSPLDCENAGGKWGPAGLSGSNICNLPTADAGIECSDSSECEGSCIADRAQYKGGVLHTRGKCTAWTSVFGCNAFVTNGIVQGVMCID